MDGQARAELSWQHLPAKATFSKASGITANVACLKIVRKWRVRIIHLLLCEGELFLRTTGPVCNESHQYDNGQNVQG